MNDAEIISEFKKLYDATIEKTEDYIKVDYCEYQFIYYFRNKTLVYNCFTKDSDNFHYLPGTKKDSFSIFNCDEINITKELFYVVEFKCGKILLARKYLPIILKSTIGY